MCMRHFENFHMQTFFFCMRLLLKTILFFASVFLQTLFLLANNLFRCLQPLQTISFKIFQHHLPTPSKK